MAAPTQVECVVRNALPKKLRLSRLISAPLAMCLAIGPSRTGIFRRSRSTSGALLVVHDARKLFGKLPKRTGWQPVLPGKSRIASFFGWLFRG